MSCSSENASSVATRPAPSPAVGIVVQLAAAAVLAMLLGACGQKGPLTLPKAAAAPASAASAP
jgi:hypothetical protein